MGARRRWNGEIETEREGERTNKRMYKESDRPRERTTDGKQSGDGWVRRKEWEGGGGKKRRGGRREVGRKGERVTESERKYQEQAEREDEG